MTVSNEEHKGRVHNGYYALDGTHPATGNFVLMPNGEAMYGGASYYREGYAPQSAVKPEPVTAPEPAPEPEYAYRTGDRVRVTDGTTYSSSVPAGSVGTVAEDAKADEFFGVIIDHDGSEWTFAAEEVEPHTEPTHRYPEGLYSSHYQDDYFVLVKHEDADEQYEIRYLSDAGENGLPVNHGMSDLVVGSYDLVREFPVR